MLAYPSLAVRDVLLTYRRHSLAESVHTDQSRREREKIFDLFCQRYGDVPVESLRSFHLSDWIADHPSWRSTATRRAKAGFIRAAFQWATDQERIARNPFAAVRYAEAERRGDLADADLARIEAEVPKEFERVLRFLRFTGCRVGELRNAKWGDVDMDRGIWVIHNHKTRRFTGKAKVVALIPQAVELLRSVKHATDVVAAEGATTEPTSHVFLNSAGRPWGVSTLRHNLINAKRRLGITSRASLHGIRHRFASAAIAAGAPIKLVSAQLGHASVVTTEQYYCDLSGNIDAIRDAAGFGQQ